jgi:hypothetical protein
VIVIEKFYTVIFYVVCPHCSLSESLSSAISEGVKSDHKLIEFVSSVEVVEIGEMIPGDL